jgi:two-component system response regulator VicR
VGKTILIVEDEQAISDILAFNLVRAGYETLSATDGQTGLDMARAYNPDLILLDIMLPVLDGFSLCRRLREEGSAVPVLMLTAREDEADKVLGLELGADDYITKPFSMRELLARVGANIRRAAADEQAPSASRPAAETEFLTAGPLTLSPSGMEVRKRGALLALSQREYDLLLFFMRRPGNVFSREELMRDVWNYEYYGDLRTVDVTIRRLREKIEDSPGNPTLLLTKRGTGYLFAGG